MSRHRFKDHFHTSLSMLCSPFFYSTLFDPILSKNDITNTVLDLKYLWVPKSGTIWLSVFHYVYLYMFVASVVRIIIFLRRRLVYNWFWRCAVFLPSAIFSIFNLISCPIVVVFRILFVGQFPRNWIPFVIFSPLALFCFFGYFQTIFIFESNFHTIIGVGKKEVKHENEDSQNNENYFPILKNNSRRLSKKQAYKIVAKNKPKNTNFKWRELKIIQIADPHIGPFMSIKELYKICERSVQRKPHLIFITGDMLTFESMNQEGYEGLSYALSPLQKMSGKVFACVGNSDYDCLEQIEEAYLENDIILLKNNQYFVDLNFCKLQIVGIDHVNGQLVTNACNEIPRNPKVDLRIMLLHDPKEFQNIPPNDKSLILSGHTHGGLLGLNFLGIRSSVSEISSVTQNFYERGENLLYIHRGQGIYGWPMRTGSNGEKSMMHIHLLCNQNKLLKLSTETTDQYHMTNPDKTSKDNNKKNKKFLNTYEVDVFSDSDISYSEN
ncbi:hypothetical protein M0813_09571 [Anaeramoeba flamelloides]|uniref:Calcineurin-like phosphoesterase domain-containing protein n=1 Tax=Anaeramoeba flamelloides TaxID=1746091 RepID=A0ABQ8X4S6_9EUKA|nr:hypothetical protein M0813_09571 [Anaeramoeba flamelloides]